VTPSASARRDGRGLRDWGRRPRMRSWRALGIEAPPQSRCVVDRRGGRIAAYASGPSRGVADVHRPPVRPYGYGGVAPDGTPGSPTSQGSGGGTGNPGLAPPSGGRGTAARMPTTSPLPVVIAPRPTGRRGHAPRPGARGDCGSRRCLKVQTGERDGYPGDSDCRRSTLGPAWAPGTRGILNARSSPKYCNWAGDRPELRAEAPPNPVGPMAAMTSSCRRPRRWRWARSARPRGASPPPPPVPPPPTPPPPPPPPPPPQGGGGGRGSRRQPMVSQIRRVLTEYREGRRPGADGVGSRAAGHGPFIDGRCALRARLPFGIALHTRITVHLSLRCTCPGCRDGAERGRGGPGGGRRPSAARAVGTSVLDAVVWWATAARGRAGGGSVGRRGGLGGAGDGGGADPAIRRRRWGSVTGEGCSRPPVVVGGLAATVPFISAVDYGGPPQCTAGRANWRLPEGVSRSFRLARGGARARLVGQGAGASSAAGRFGVKARLEAAPAGVAVHEAASPGRAHGSDRWRIEDRGGRLLPRWLLAVRHSTALIPGGTRR
jgi:hypothetical protein